MFERPSNLFGVQSVHMKGYEANAKYRRGIEQERLAAYWLAEHMPTHDIVFADADVNVKKDVDFIVYQADTRENGVSVSFKYQPSATKTGKLAFELEAYSMTFHRWMPSWYRTCKAHYWMMGIPSTPGYYIIRPSLLRSYVSRYGWESTRTLTKDSQASQWFHDHRDAKIGLLSIAKLRRERLAVLLQLESLESTIEMRLKYYD